MVYFEYDNNILYFNYDINVQYYKLSFVTLVYIQFRNQISNNIIKINYIIYYKHNNFKIDFFLKFEAKFNLKILMPK